MVAIKKGADLFVVCLVTSNGGVMVSSFFFALKDMEMRRTRRGNIGGGGGGSCWGCSSMSPPPVATTTALLIFFICIFDRSIAISASNYTSHKGVASLRLARIQRHLDKINKQPIKTIEVRQTKMNTI